MTDEGKSPIAMLWDVYDQAMAWVENCPAQYREWAWDDADLALRHWEQAVERELFRQRPDLRRRPWLV